MKTTIKSRLIEISSCDDLPSEITMEEVINADEVDLNDFISIL